MPGSIGMMSRVGTLLKRVLILVHRREILKQTSHKISAGKFEHGLILAGLNLDLEHPIQIAGIQTLWDI